ncbi:autotransporter domain-containing protein [Mesorhizobium sp. SB112]|uniref:autotransporter domain-containing protein n=1 Tax=Mesorhizobium sp. SB112 TaxID=3151853 RepID=UPI0032644FE3
MASTRQIVRGIVPGRLLAWTTSLMATTALFGLGDALPVFAQTVIIDGAVNPNPPQPGSNLYVGLGTGALTITDGATVTNADGYIGHLGGSDGTVIVTGAGSTWTNTGTLDVGSGGTGALTIADGATVTNTNGTIAYNSGSNGTVTVTGPGSTWINTGYLYVGNPSTGSLTIEDGGTVTSAVGYIGVGRESDSSVIVTGPGSTWTNTDTLSVGYSGIGELVIEDRGAVHNSNGFIGEFANSTGTVIVTGADSTWTNTGNLYVGYSGSGTLTVEDGGTVSNMAGSIGNFADAIGTVLVTGDGSTWTNRVLDIGASGDGTLNVEAGATVISSGSLIASNAGSTGKATVTGVGSSWLNDGLLYVGNYGNGTLNVEAGGTVTSLVGYIGFWSSSMSAATVTGQGSSLTTEGVLYVGVNGNGTLLVENGGTVTNRLASNGGVVMDTLVSVGSSHGSEGRATVTGTGSRLDNGGRLYVGGSEDDAGGTGTLTVEDGGVVGNTIGLVGVGSNALGTVAVTGAGSAWTNSGSLYIGRSGAGALTVSDGGSVSSDNGTGLVEIAQNPGSTGTINIGSAAGDAAVAAGTLFAHEVRFGAGNGTLVFNHTGSFAGGAAHGFLPAITGTGTIDHLAGDTSLLTDSLGFGGTTSVSGGSLTLSGALGGSATVTGGSLIVQGGIAGDINVSGSGSLGGSGMIGGSVDMAGGVLLGRSGATLTINSDLMLNASSNVNVALGAPSITRLFDVGGNLTLDGTLNITDAGGFGVGVYRLFNYDGVLTDNGLVFGTVPPGINPDGLFIQTAASNQVNLLSTSGVELGFWDGGDDALHDNDLIDGGNGIWRADGRNWTDHDGVLNGAYQPNPTFAVFQGQAGTVTVDTGAAAIAATGMQFATDGYRIEGDAITLDGLGGESIIRVGDGTEAGAVMSATIASEMTGTTRLVLSDRGTLVLEGANTYTGGTELRSGTLSVSNDSNLGDLSGDLVFAGGALGTTASFDSTRATQIDGGFAVLDIAAGTTLGLSGEISGVGDLVHRGTGTLVLSGANTYTGMTVVNSGALIGDASSIRGIVASGGTVIFDQVNTASYAGHFVGAAGVFGEMILRGGGRLTLEGTSFLDWSIEGGTLVSATERFTGDLDIASGAGFVFDQASDGSYAGVVSGSGDLAFIGGGTIALTGNNPGFTGFSTITGSTLIVTDTLGGSALIGSGSMLGGSGTIGSGARSLVTIASGGTLSGQTGATLTIDGHLAFDAGSSVNVALGGLSTTALFNVAENLTLDGTLNVSDAGGFGAGVYRLFDYGGALTDNGLDIETAPGGIDADDLTVQTAVAGRVNLISSAGVDLGFWDGGDTSLHDNGQVDGGAGAWRADGRNWTSQDGIANGPYRPNPTYAVFQGSAGTVSVDNSAGGLGVVGMQFVTGGYRIEGDAIALEKKNGQSVIRVGDGSAAGASTTATIGSALTGASNLVKDDLGTLILTGANTYAGDTLVRAGTLIGNTTSIRNNIANAGTVVFDQADSATFSGDITGLNGATGEMTLRGGGVLTLAGISTLDWSVEDGTLVSASNRFTGDLDIASDAGFIFDQADNGTYAGMLSGAGELSFIGGGAVMLTGDSSGFRGLSTVAGSTLIVNRTLGGSALIGMDGRLAGTGTIGSGSGSQVTIASGGTLAPGHSIGTLTVDGDLVLASGSRFEVEVAPGGTNSDLVTVTGTATINGGTVAHIGMTGAYDPTATYTILSADGGLAAGSAFDDVTSDFAFLDPTLGYGANDITLTLTRNDIGFADVGITRNQIATAGGLESLAFGNDLYDAVVQLDVATARSAFDQLSGEIHGSVITGLVEDSRQIRNAANDRIRAAFGDVAASATPVLAYGPDGPVLAPADGDHFGMSAWGTAYGSWGSTDSDGNAALIDRSTGGVLLGADALVTDQLRLGLLAGYSHSSVDLDARASSASIDTYHLGLYGGTQWVVPNGTLSLRGGLAYSWHDIKTARSVGFIGFADSLSADYDANTFQAFGELGYGIETDIARFEPFVNLAHVNVRTDGFSEDGGVAALSGASGSNGVTFTTLGVRTETAIDLGEVNARLNGMIGWRHAFGDTIPESSHAFAGSDVFTIAGSPIGRNALVLDAGLDLDLTPDATLGLSYQGQFASGAQDHGFKANLAIRF